MKKNKTIGVQTIGEEIANAVSHGLGTGLSIAGMIILIVFAVKNGLGAMGVISASLYGFGLILLYTNSSLYHSLTNPRAKGVFRVLDHCSIFILILSTYIPIALTIIGGALGWVVFGVCTACTIVGVVLTAVNLERWKKLSMILYLVMGWMALLLIKTLLSVLVPAELVLLVLGGAAYTLGVFFYKNKNVKFMHFIWHIFVMAGSVLHYFMILHFYMR